MEEKSCELGEIFQDGDETCIDEPKLCLRCSGGIWERISESDDSEFTPSNIQNKTGTK
jgi:hypothetical protein